MKVITPLGWGVLGGAVAAWVLGALLGWGELLIAAAAGLLTLALCALFTVGRTRLSVQIDVQPRRVVAGHPSAGRLRAVNHSRTRLLPVLLEVPVGVARAQFSLRRLHTGEIQVEVFALATTRRGVVPVGPASTVRADPFGLLRRSQSWSEIVELIVHPITVPIEPLGAGVLRDLEGRTTNDVSTSDLAFHTLREYAPGDDRRYIHWRSSARASALGGETRLLVRQFLDTRRSHLSVVVDGRSSAYLDETDYETALSAAASVVRRAFEDEVQVTVLAGEQLVADEHVHLAMDSFARASLGTSASLADRVAQAAPMAPDTTVALLVTGANTDFAELRRAANHYAPEVNVVAVRVDPTQPANLTGSGQLTVLGLPQLSGLRALLAGTSA